MGECSWQGGNWERDINCVDREEDEGCERETKLFMNEERREDEGSQRPS